MRVEDVKELSANYVSGWVAADMKREQFRRYSGRCRLVMLLGQSNSKEAANTYWQHDHGTFHSKCRYRVSISVIRLQQYNIVQIRKFLKGPATCIYAIHIQQQQPFHPGPFTLSLTFLYLSIGSTRYTLATRRHTSTRRWRQTLRAPYKGVFPRPSWKCRKFDGRVLLRLKKVEGGTSTTTSVRR